jgi:hypothetical protein
MDQACDTTLLPNDEEIERKTMVAAYAAQIALLDGCGEAVSGGYAGTKSGQQQVLPGQLGAIAATFSKLRASGVQASGDEGNASVAVGADVYVIV